MLIEESFKRQTELEKNLYKMALSPLEEDDLRDIAGKLKALYSYNFRHSYARFYPLILEIAKDENEYNLDYLSDNLESIRILVEKDYFDGEKEFKGLYYPLSKLSDHLNLEIGRHNHYSEYESRVKDLLQQNESMAAALKEAQDSADKANNKAANMQTEYTTILGIFAAIILAFTGSFSFAGSVLNNIHQASVYRLVIISLVVGFVTFNIISILIDFIIRINNKELASESLVTSIFKNCKVILFNVFVIICIILTCIAYKNEWFEKQASTKIINVGNGQSNEGATTIANPVLNDATADETLQQEESENTTSPN